jgi:hypothetical protein
MKKMKFLCCSLLVVALLSGCKKDLDTAAQDVAENKTSNVVERYELRVENGRLVFNDFEHFLEVSESLDGLSEEELTHWEDQRGIKSLRGALQTYYADPNEPLDENLEDMANFRFPRSFQALLNADGECRLGDFLVWYHKGLKHHVPNADEARLTQIKADPSLSDDTAEAGASVAKVESQTSRVSLGANQVDARHQKEFWQYSYYGQPIQGHRKYVHELVTYTETRKICKECYYAGYTKASINVKLEWRGKRWRPAGEDRRISYNLQYSASCTVSGWPGTVTQNGTVIQAPYIGKDREIILLVRRFHTDYKPKVTWSIDVRGNIQQHVVGDAPGNLWNNVGNPLW